MCVLYIFRKTRWYGPFAGMTLLACSNLMCGQSAQPDACHMDSDGFCVPGGVQSAPILGPVPRNDLPVASSPVPQDMLKGGSSSTLQGKLQVELRNDLLQIDAENVTLRDALKAVSARTGAEIQ